MSIGEDLAAARQRAGLTLADVSQRTRIREAIVRGIESDSYADCGGDFYARGFIRAIAQTVGADPGPLIRDYDAAHQPAQAPTTARLLGPGTPASPAERRRLNWSAMLALALAVAIGVAAYLFVSAPGHPLTAARTERQHAAPPTAPVVTPGPVPHVGEVVIELTAISDCWVEFTAPGGRYLFQSYVVAGSSKRWVFRRAVDMRLGNPAGVRLIVNGKNAMPPGTKQAVTLRLGGVR
jgi:cytoskeletal protein RodZ